MKEIISKRDSVRSVFFDPTSKPVAEVVSGETVRYVNTWTHWGNEAKFGMSFAEREPLRHQYPKDFGVTQYANQENSAYAVKPPKGIYVSIPKNVFPPEQQAQIIGYLKGGAADDGE